MKRIITLTLVAFIAIGMSFSQVNLEDGLEGYYQFEEGSGVVAANSVAFGLAPPGELKDNPAWVDGKWGTALEFDNSLNNRVEVGTYDPTLGLETMSIAAWVFWKDIGSGWHGICSKREGWETSKFHWDIATDNSVGNLQFEVYHNAMADKQVCLSDSALADSAWTHIVLTFDGATATWYFNGALSNEGPMVYGDGDGSREAVLAIGSTYYDGADAFNGIIDEVRMYSRVLSAEEVTALYAYNPLGSGVKEMESNNIRLSNYPNPVNNATTIYYNVKDAGNVTVKIIDCTGKEITSLVNSYQPAGNNSVYFDPSDLPNGLYLYNLEIENEIIAHKKMLIIK